MIAHDLSSAEEWRRHWKLALSAFVGASMMSIAVPSLGAFMVPLEQEFGWTRAQMSSGLMIYAVLGVLCSPFLGNMIDRWGPRRFAVPGVILCGLAFALFGTVTGSAWHLLALWLVFSIACQVPRPLVWVTAISSEFNAARGLAIAVVVTGGTVGGMIAPIVATELIASVGWRLAYVIMGVAWGGISGLFCLLYFYGRRDRMALALAAHEKVAEIVLPGLSVAEGVRSANLVKLCLATLLANTVNVGLLVHLIPILNGSGLDRTSAAWLVGLGSSGAILGKFLCGLAVTRFRGTIVMAVVCVFLMAACLLFMGTSTSVAERSLPVILHSISAGGIISMFPYLTSRYFGLRAYGTLFGFVASMMALGVGLGPLLGGLLYDGTGSYTLFLSLGFIVTAAAGLLLLSMGKYPIFDEIEAQPIPVPSLTPALQTGVAKFANRFEGDQ